MQIYEFSEFFSRTTGGGPNQMNMAPYEGHPFECACGETHKFYEDTVSVIRELPKMRLVFVCPEDEHVTCVKVKGILRFKGFEALFGAICPVD